MFPLFFQLRFLSTSGPDIPASASVMGINDFGSQQVFKIMHNILVQILNNISFKHWVSVLRELKHWKSFSPCWQKWASIYFRLRFLDSALKHDCFGVISMYCLNLSFHGTSQKEGITQTAPRGLHSVRHREEKMEAGKNHWSRRIWTDLSW